MWARNRNYLKFKKQKMFSYNLKQIQTRNILSDCNLYFWVRLSFPHEVSN